MKKLLLTLMACFAVLCANAWTVYFTNPNGWSEVAVYTFTGDVSNPATGDWPGKLMTYDATNNRWYYTSTGTYDNPEMIIFNNNNNNSKTKDLTFIDGETYPTIYVIGSNVDGQSWSDNTNQMTYNTSSGLYEWSGATLGKGFKMRSSPSSWDVDFNLGAPKSGITNLTPGTAFKLQNEDNDNINFSNDVELLTNAKMSLDLKNLSLTVTGTAGSLPDIFGEKIWVVGVNSWDLNTSAQTITLAETTSGSKIYEGEVPINASMGSVYFRFYTSLDAGYDAYTYGPKEDDGDNVKVGFTNDSYTSPMVAGKGSWEVSDFNGTIKMTVDFNNSMNVIFTVAKEEEDVLPETVYLAGNFNSWSSDDESYKLTSTQEGIYTAKFTLNKEYTYESVTAAPSFKLVIDNNWFGVLDSGNGENNVTLTETQPTVLNITTPGSDINLVDWEGGEVNFVLNWGDTKTLTLIYTASTPETPVTYPDNLYLLGDVEGWNPAAGIEATTANSETGVYTFSNIDLEGYFSFTTMLGADADTWPEDQYRYVPTVNGAAITKGGTFPIASFVQCPNNSFVAQNGNYDLSVNFETMQMTVTVNSLVEVSKTLYIVGNGINGAAEWGATDSNVMTENNGVYTWTGTSLSGGFKFNNGSWNEGYNIGAPAAGQYIVLDEAFTVVNDNDSKDINVLTDYTIENPTVTLDLNNLKVTVTGTLVAPENPYVPEVIYLKGDFNSWGETTPLNKNENGLYTGSVNISADLTAFEFKLDCGNDKWYGCDNDEQDVDFSTANTLTLGINAAGSNWVVSDWQGGNLAATVDWDAQTLVLTYKKASVGIDAIYNAIDGGEAIYNLQGVKVNKDSLKKGIYIINGKKVLVK